MGAVQEPIKVSKKRSGTDFERVNSSDTEHWISRREELEYQSRRCKKQFGENKQFGAAVLGKRKQSIFVPISKHDLKSTIRNLYNQTPEVKAVN